jgi:uncharacterized protein
MLQHLAIMWFYAALIVVIVAWVAVAYHRIKQRTEAYRTVHAVSIVLSGVHGLMSAVAPNDTSHGIEHVLNVLHHAQRAIISYEESTKSRLSYRKKSIIELACILHDIDDKKYFATTDHANARYVLADLFDQNHIDMIIECIELVATSVNGNRIDPNIPLWLYIPRFADRLEAMGPNGIKRCLDYNHATNQPMRTESTPLPTTLEQVQAHAIPERFQDYCNGKRSASVIDHFYDKLLHLRITTTIPYIDNLMESNHQYMLDWVAKSNQKANQKANQ